MRSMTRGDQKPAGRPIRLAVWLLAMIALAVTAGGWLTVRADVTVTPRGMRVDDHPFFPVGIYYAPREKFGQLRRMGFTVTHVWASGGEGTRRVLDESHRFGLRAVVELTEARLRSNPFLPTIRQFVLASRAHPALLAWYLYDEPDREALGRIQQGFQLIRELDPAHPVLIVHNFPERGGAFVPYLDVFGVDPYPVPNMPLSFVSNQVVRARSVAGAGRPVWAVIQAFVQGGAGPPVPVSDAARAAQHGLPGDRRRRIRNPLLQLRLARQPRGSRSGPVGGPRPDQPRTRQPRSGAAGRRPRRHPGARFFQRRRPVFVPRVVAARRT